jgi:hypothetical protein
MDCRFARRRGRLPAGDPRHLIRLRRPDDTTSVVNATISGCRPPCSSGSGPRCCSDTGPAGSRCSLAPTTPRYGSGASKPLVTGTETARNLTETRSQAAAPGARVICMTPTACDTARIAACPPFQGQQVRRELSDPADLAAVDAMVIEHQQVPPPPRGRRRRADSTIEHLPAVVPDHLAYQERQVLPLIEQHLTPAQ